jgi:2,4-dienoyl-CoA reductase-like NADH-dependent reductase (Old Yellow Enzyme family)
MDKAMQAGFEFVQIGRATIRDTNIIRKMQAGEITDSDCDHCNRCVAAMATEGVTCISETRGFLRKQE